MTIRDAFHCLDDFVDPSDPDVDVPNSVHAYQTAERALKERSGDRAYALLGLIHDVGKVLFSMGLPNTFVVGDTHIVGCAHPESAIYPETFAKCPDAENPLYNTKYGIYYPHCGLRQVVVTYGHDEYLYSVLEGNRGNHIFPEQFWQIVRFHSLYPWHTGGDYRHLASKEDDDLLTQVKQFNAERLVGRSRKRRLRRE